MKFAIEINQKSFISQFQIVVKIKLSFFIFAISGKLWSARRKNKSKISKGKSLYREGMSPCVRSTSRPKWTRLPSQQCYYWRNDGGCYKRGCVFSVVIWPAWGSIESTTILTTHPSLFFHSHSSLFWKKDMNLPIATLTVVQNYRIIFPVWLQSLLNEASLDRHYKNVIWTCYPLEKAIELLLLWQGEWL